LYEILYELYEGEGETRTEREIVEAVARRRVELVRQHRAHLARLYRISHTLARGIEYYLSGCMGVSAHDVCGIDILPWLGLRGWIPSSNSLH
jgi:hypothetical protein